MFRSASHAVIAAALLAGLGLSQGNPAAAPPDAKYSAAGGAPREMRTHVNYAFTIDAVPEGSQSVRAWIPVPETDPYQTISNVTVEPKVGEMKRDPLYGNSILFIEWKKPAAGALKGTISYDVARREEIAHKETKESAALEKRFLEPDRLALINDRIKDMAKKATDGKSTTVDKGRGIYDFVLGYMNYSKEGTGWGRGDVVWACDAKYGNCSDFHSLFTSMARASNIPARFHYGFSLKPDGTTAAHCWAEFKDPEKGWFPVDISEARKVVEKEPAKANYYFGTLSENRVRLSTGRDIVLDPKQAGEPLNFFYAPYVEIDGKSVAPKLDVTHQEKKG
jgi:transglutaminase-like putative cysteine protease